MKKKNMKKLVLAKETVRNLETGNLKQVAGGSVYSMGLLTCDPTLCYEEFNSRQNC